MQQFTPFAQDIEDKFIKELWSAGLGPLKISKLVGISYSEIKNRYGDENPHPLNEQLVDNILYSNNYPVALDVIVSNEKERFKAYSKLESTCLDVMNKLLTYYASQPIGVDLKADQFTAKLATDFIRVTHNARQELIQKYAVDKMSDKKEEGIKIQFVEGQTDDKDTSDI